MSLGEVVVGLLESFAKKIVKEKILKVVSMLCLQHFYNKSQEVSCYWFKFETNTKITLLPQQ